MNGSARTASKFSQSANFRLEPDEQVLAQADKTQALLITEDKDFGEMVYRHHAAHQGVVLLRLAGRSREVRAALISQAFQLHASEFLHAFSVITPAGIRIRPPAPPAEETPPEV